MMRAPVVRLLETHAHLVARDVRPAACEAVQDRYLEEVRELAKRQGLSTYTETHADGWKVVWLYKHPHVGCIIRQTEKVPATAFEHWVMGKLFGYSEQAIADYLMREGLTHLDELGPVAAGARGQRVGRIVESDLGAISHTLVCTLAGLLACGRHLAHLAFGAVVRSSTFVERSRHSGRKRSTTTGRRAA